MPIEVSIREIRKQLLIEAAGLTPGDDRIATIAELTGAFHFLTQVHRSAGALLPIAEGGVKNDNFVGHLKRKSIMLSPD